MIFSFAENLKFVDSYLNVGIHSGFGDEHFKLGPVKLMIDGSSSGPTAATIEPYAIDPNNYGILSHSQELVDEYILRAQMEDWQITSHAVGDKGITVIVNAIEKAMKQYPREDCRHRIEVKLAILYHTQGEFAKALTLIEGILKETRKADDKHLLVEG